MSKKKKPVRPMKKPPTQARPKQASEVQPEFQQELEERFGSTLDLSDAPDEMKLSAKLIDILEPFSDEDLPYSVLYDCAAIAWNECLKEDWNTKTSCALGNMLMDFTRYRELINALKERKRLLFSYDTRAIRKVKVYETEDGRINVNVASDWDAMTALRATLDRLTKDE